MYIKRDAEKKLLRFAKQYPVVTINGPRQSGKTTLCKEVFMNKDYVSLESFDNRDFAKNDPRGFLSQFKNGVIIDEIQRVPELTSYIQEIVDKNQVNGEFIITGSSQFHLYNTVSQSLAGRTALIKLMPFSYTEIYSKTLYDRSWINKLIFTGFYPRIFKDKLNPTDYYSSYFETYVERDLRSFSEINNLNTFRTFLRICAARVGQLINYSSISNDLGISNNTVKKWISILEESYIIFLLRPFYSNIKKRLIKSPKLYFYDTGLCSYLNGASSENHIENLPNRGSLFENFIISEFYKMTLHNNLNNELFFYRDKTGNEIDLLINDGLNITPIEIKSGATFNQNFTKNLKYFNRLEIKSDNGSILYTGKSQPRSDFQVYNYYEYFKNYSQT